EFFTGDQVWRPRFTKSESFGVTVLAFDIASAAKKLDDIRVVVRGITAAEWAEYAKMFRFTQEWRQAKAGRLFRPYREERGEHTGTVLLDAEQKGRVYVGGIFVATEEKLRYGYDLPPSRFALDRDRRSLDGWTLRSVLASLWQ